MDRSGCTARDRTLLSVSHGVCRECGRICDARYVADATGVYLERHCPAHGPGRALVAETLAWYLDAQRFPSRSRPPDAAIVPRRSPCPGSCGPCGFHAQRCHLPVLSITNACDLRCPICFTYNRDDIRYWMGEEEFLRHVEYVIQATGGVDLINITGGEPTLHPNLLRLLRLAQRPEIGRVTVNSNGLNIARDPDLVRGLADLGVYVILSLDTLDPETSIRIHGRDLCEIKRRALDQLERFGVQTTLLMVLVGGVNESELGRIVDLALGRAFVRSLTIQTMTYTGQGGSTYQPRRPIPVEGVERRVEEATSGRIPTSSFVPLPTAHPLCYGVSYLLCDGPDDIVPLAGLLGRDKLVEHLADGYLLHPTDALESDLRGAIDHEWAHGGPQTRLALLKRIVQTMYPSGTPLTIHERQRLAERSVKTIYVHAHMDEDTFEVGRAIRCPDQVPVDANKLISACNYNLFYRRKDPRFWVEP